MAEIVKENAKEARFRLARSLLFMEKETTHRKKLGHAGPAQTVNKPFREVRRAAALRALFRTQRHVRWVRKPCVARFPYAVSRPGVPQGREGNGANLSEKIAAGELFRHAELGHAGPADRKSGEQGRKTI